jgi:hypothetical protein
MSVAFSIFNLYARRYRATYVHLDWVGLSLGLLLWPLATLAAFFSVGLALFLYAFVVLFYVALPILRERARTAALADGGSLGITHEHAGATEPSCRDLGQDP